MDSTLISRRGVTFDFEILETYSAGVSLLGHEVKSLRAKKGSLEGAHIVVRGGEAFLVGASIPAYQQTKESKGYEPERPRKLLLTKKELDELLNIESTKGLTLVPLKLYNSKRLIKVSFAVVRGKKTHDKREDIKKRDIDRDIERTLKNQ
jgi:SsrA-binding protein